MMATETLIFYWYTRFSTEGPFWHRKHNVYQLNQYCKQYGSASFDKNEIAVYIVETSAIKIDVTGLYTMELNG